METLVSLIIGIVILVPVIVILLVPVAIWRGYVMSVLWGWFIAPTFNIATIGIVTAIGISLVIGMFSQYKSNPKGVEDLSGRDYFTNGFLLPAIALGIGYILTYWM